ncbi:MAG: ATP-binding protein [Planctomycetota bacterium]
MGYINLAEKTINAKLVYYGCGMGGKTTSLQVVHEIMCPRNEVQLVSIKTEEDATLLFDFLPLDLGSIDGFKVRIQGFTVPGQPKYRRMRRYVLSGADAVVFVVDSEASRVEENQQSFDSLLENLHENGIDPTSIPIVLQYNKRDLPEVSSEDDLDRRFRIRDDIVAFPSVATTGHGVFEAFVETAAQLIAQKVRLYGLGRGKVDPDAVAATARDRLWAIHDRSDFRAHGRDATGRHDDSLELTFDDVPDSQPMSGATILAEQDESDIFSEATLEAMLPSGSEAASTTSAGPAEYGAPQGRVSTPVDDQEPLPELLDATVASNLELVTRYGELDRYRVLLEQKNRELVGVAQNVVHDLNRPLAAIKLMLASMKKGYFGAMEDAATRAVDHGLTAIKVMERLIGDLLESSRLEFDGVRLVFREVDMNLLVSDIVDLLSYEIEEKGIEVRCEPMPKIVCDAWGMSRVLSNLIGNAVQYASADRSPRVHVSMVSRGSHWSLLVSDNGIGIPASDLPRLFGRFERGSNTGGISGTGLGLHIVREIVLGHGGEVRVESVEGAGTTFCINLPLEPVQPPHSRVSDAADPAVSKRLAAAAAEAKDAAPAAVGG